MNSLTRQNFKILSGSMLKLLAILCMAIDHAALILWPVVDLIRLPLNLLGRSVTVYWVMRKIGRLAFPIFCFLIAEGYVHTRNKLKYALRLLIFAVISEIPFNLMHGGTFWDLSGQNVYWTLCLGLMLIHTYESSLRGIIKFPAMAAIAAIAMVLKADYGLNGVLLVFLLYLLRDIPVAKTLLAYPLLSGGYAAFAAFIPINLYNGQRGFIQAPWTKLLFYIFYPAHILVLIGIRYLIA